MEASRLKDVTYHLKAELTNLYAQQSNQKEMLLPEKFSIEFDRKDIFKQGDSELERVRHKKTRKMETKKIPLCYFPIDAEKLIIEWGSYSGIFKTQIRRVVKEQRMLSYRRQPWWDLMTVLPERFELEPSKKMKIKERVEPRGMHRGNVAYEVIPKLAIDFDVTFSSSALPTDQEVVDLMHAVEGSPFGPTKNGEFRILSMDRV